MKPPVAWQTLATLMPPGLLFLTPTCCSRTFLARYILKFMPTFNI